MKTDKPILELVNEFLSELENSEGTKILYNKTLQYFITWAVKNCCDIRNVTKADLIGYKNQMKLSGRSPATVDNYLCSIRKFFTWLMENEYISFNPAASMSWERDRKGTFIKQALTAAQVLKLLNYHNQETAISKRNHALIDLMSYTGLRCIEVSRLNKSDIKRAGNRWLLQIQRKGSKEKSGVIAVPYDRIRPLQDYWKFRTDQLTDESPVFVNHSPRSNNTRIKPAGLSRIIKLSLIGIGLNSSSFTAHSLRHTAATFACFAGCETWEISRMLGHNNIRQTESYIHSLGIESRDQGRATMKINDFIKKYGKSQKKNKNSGNH